ncbi:ATP-binding protein [Brevibacillus sp. NPDC058079]|uniref:ATP-binding protein n=1 Tax=Brevibacillus sp. NPDC058079 TaxID=3346330 RepID=UPI0036E82DA4
MVKVMEKDVLTYPISLNYGHKDWNVISALREFLSNMLDTQREFEVKYDGKFAYIEDQGDGLPKSSFILGESTRNGSQIGQFGEGLKLGFITLLRENRKVEVSTVGMDIQVDAVGINELYFNGENLLDSLNENATPEQVKENEETKVMKLTFTPNKRKVGTLIKVQCSESELEEANSLFLKLREPQRVDAGIFLPGGSIYVLGLRTAKMPNMLFSYNIEDKTMTNRDRNIVDTAKLQANIVKVLERAKNQKFIQTILSSFQTNTTAYEYQLAFKPYYIDAWKKAMEKLYPKVCLSSDLKSDLIAHVMGYTVLRNVPYHLLQIFRQLGCKESSHFASQYNGEGLEKKNKIVYPISDSYVADWQREDAIREFIANALDAGDPRLVHNGKEARISDSGEGIMKKNMVLGGTSKNNQANAIGKFGEGLKMACLVLARTGSNVKIETVGTTYTAMLEYNEEFESNLLVIEYVKNARKKGSSIVFECTEEELQSAKNKFIHFQGLRKKPVSLDNLEVYLEGNGRIYVNGLETAEKTGIFNYNVLDKVALDSRDRNSVDESRFRHWLARFLSKTNNEEIISAFLSKWKDNSRAIEYEIQFIPASSTLWTKATKKIFTKTAFSSGSYDDSDFITKQAGYELLSNVPYALRQILEKAGIPASSSIASKYRGKGILLDNKIVYPISSGYASNWTIPMALKEIIANALDADRVAKVTYNKETGMTVITDKGEGISTKHLLFGESNKSKEDANIGMFGEGFKMAALVAARNNRAFVVTTKGMRYEAKLERDSRFHADVLVIYLQPSRKRIGTEIEFGSKQSEHEAAKSNFLTFNTSYVEIEDGVFEIKGGRSGLFVNGCFVRNIDSLYSYNLNKKDMLNRDRTTVDEQKLRSALALKWSSISNKDIIETFMKCQNANKLEMQLSFSPFTSVMPAWKAVAKKLFNKCCFASGTDHDGVARDKGFQLLMGVPDLLSRILHSCGIPSSQEAVTLRGDEKDVKKRASESELTLTGKRRWNKAMKIYTKLYGNRVAKRVEIVAEFGNNPQDGITLGLYNFETDMVYVSLDLINDDRRYPFHCLMGTLIHEHMHRTTKAHDRTRDFERGLTEELGRIAEMLRLAE